MIYKKEVNFYRKEVFEFFEIKLENKNYINTCPIKFNFVWKFFTSLFEVILFFIYINLTKFISILNEEKYLGNCKANVSGLDSTFILVSEFLINILLYLYLYDIKKISQGIIGIGSINILVFNLRFWMKYFHSVFKENIGKEWQRVFRYMKHKKIGCFSLYNFFCIKHKVSADQSYDFQLISQFIIFDISWSNNSFLWRMIKYLLLIMDRQQLIRNICSKLVWNITIDTTDIKIAIQIPLFI